MTRATGSSAVMAARAPASVEADDDRTALYRKLEYFPTPPWAARAGAELIRFLDPGSGVLWEPACGEGHMAASIEMYFEETFASDIHPFGYGTVCDFLQETAADRDGPQSGAMCDWIVTNPPFGTAAELVRLGLRRARIGVAILQRLQFLETPDRYELMHGAQPMTTCAPFAERVPMTLGRWDPAASTATGYAWFVWMKDEKPRPMMGIPPGTKARLTRPGDAARFGWSAEAGLLERMEA